MFKIVYGSYSIESLIMNNCSNYFYKLVLNLLLFILLIIWYIYDIVINFDYILYLVFCFKEIIIDLIFLWFILIYIL